MLVESSVEGVYVDRVAQHGSSIDRRCRQARIENHIEVVSREYMAISWGLSIIDCWRGCRWSLWSGREGRGLSLAVIKTSNLDLGKERRANTLGHVVSGHIQATRQ